jgi:ferritin-like protein
MKLRDGVRKIADSFDQGARESGFVSRTHAVDFVRSLRALTSRVAPEGERPLFGAYNRTAEEVYNWGVKNLGDVKLANQLRDEFIIARAKQDWNGLAGLQDKVIELYNEKFPDRSRGERPNFTPLLESDLPHAFYFPADRVLKRAEGWNKNFNALGRMHRKIIVSGAFPAPFVLPFGGGESLFWKHAIADSLRAQAGGRGIFALDRDAVAAKKLVNEHLATNPATRRQLEMDYRSSKDGEFRWMTGTQLENREMFRTGEIPTTTAARLSGESAGMWAAAAKYVRRHMNDEALDAYTKSSPDNLEPLIGHALGNQNVRRGIVAGKQEERSAESLRFAGEEHAALMFQRYQEIEHSLTQAGRSMEELSAITTGAKLGKQEEAIADYLRKHQVDMPIHKPQVEKGGLWDGPMNWWIGKLMTFNKFNRQSLYHNLLYSTVSDLQKSGWDLKHAIPVASDVAKSQTIYHMLDFSNMLQAEQSLRWLSYFATKHRLYWTWVAKYFIKRPTIALALKQVANQDLHLDDKGNWNMSIGGHAFYIPATRLLWVNSRELPQTSPAALGLQGLFTSLVKGKSVAQSFTDALEASSATQGNIVTRSDSAWRWWMLTTSTWMGHGPATYQSATRGASDIDKHQFAQRMVEYAIHYEQQHGRLPSEEQSVKFALLHSAIRESWRSNLPVPIITREGDPHVRNLFAQMDKITSPSKRADFIDAHPDLQLWLGTSDPDVWFHTTPLWNKFNALRDALEAHKQEITQRVLQSGSASPKDLKALHDAGAAFSMALTGLLKEDARTWAGSPKYPRGNEANYMEKPGPFGRQLQGDPFAAKAFIHEVFPKVSNDELNKHTVTQRIVDLRKELALLREPNGWKADGLPDERHGSERISELNDLLAPFNAYPKDAINKAEQRYYKDYVLKYRKLREQKQNAISGNQDKGIAGLPPGPERDKADVDFAAWRDSQDHPVEIKIGGKTIKFPSPVRIGYANTPTPQREAIIAQRVANNPMHLAPYELQFLGVKTPGKLSEAQQAFQNALTEYHLTPGVKGLKDNQKTGLAKEIDKVYPGFFKFYLFSNKPTIERFETLRPYRKMDPAQKQLFDQYIGGPARETARNIKAGNKQYYESYWRDYVRSQVLPWLKNEEPALGRTIAMYDRYGGKEFLNSLVSP